jgi:RNA polymerase sigma-70 factor (ECF subfamily)
MLQNLVLTKLMIVLCAGFVLAQADFEVSVQSMPPVVVKTFPVAGDTQVDPGIKEIRVTFSKDMQTKMMWSWVYFSKDSFPEIAGEVRYLPDKRTCVLPVKLKPGKAYAIWINSQQHNSFRDLNNKPAISYLLVFQTR